MKYRSVALIAAIVGLLAGCSPHYLTRDVLCDKDSDGKATSRAARCLIAAGIEAAQANAKDSQDQSNGDEGGDIDPPRIR